MNSTDLLLRFGDVVPSALALFGNLLRVPIRVGLFDLGLVVLHEEEIGGQGALGSVRIMRLAPLLALETMQTSRCVGAPNCSSSSIVERGEKWQCQTAGVALR